MYSSRRKFILAMTTLSSALALGYSFLNPRRVFSAWKERPFQAITLSDALHGLIGTAEPEPSDQILLKAPHYAEDGSVVPIKISSTLEDVRSISILIEKNPTPLAAQFQLTSRAEAYVSTQLKIAESSDIIALVETSEGYYIARERVEISISGCS